MITTRKITVTELAKEYELFTKHRDTSSDEAWDAKSDRSDRGLPEMELLLAAAFSGNRPPS
jgi:hypothetical protein